MKIESVEEKMNRILTKTLEEGKEKAEIRMSDFIEIYAFINELCRFKKEIQKWERNRDDS